MVETFGASGWREMVALRALVLRTPLGLAFSPDQLEAERDDLHLALRLDHALAGTLLVRRHAVEGGPDGARFRQMAIDPRRRGAGLGTRLLRAGERMAARRGARHGILHAREVARPFYARCGWVASGDPFEEVTLPHVRMTKALDPV